MQNPLLTKSGGYQQCDLVKQKLSAESRRFLRFGPARRDHLIVLILVVHFFLGFRRLRDIGYYRDDPMVLRLLGLNRLPDVSTVSRPLASADAQGISNLRSLCRQMLRKRLQALGLRRVTLDA